MGAEEPRQCVEHFRNWLHRKMTGCLFASELAAAGAISYQVILPDFSKEELPGVAKFIDESAVAHRSAILLFPHLRSAEQLAPLLQILAVDRRWTVSRVDWKVTREEQVGRECVLVGVDWTTSTGDTSSAMGFAPLGSMPVTRRAPYFALALWSGGHENPYKKTPAKRVGFIDAAHSLTKAKHDRRWIETEELVQRLLADPADDAAVFRRVAFCLEASAVSFLDPS